MKGSYTKDFKIKACKLVVKEGIKAAIVAEKMGINRVVLYRWIQEYTAYGDDAFVGKGRQRSSEAELKKALRRIHELELEIEILKKAAAYFAQHPGNE